MADNEASIQSESRLAKLWELTGKAAGLDQPLGPGDYDALLKVYKREGRIIV